jgi:Xaa-Pro aminopeptidase
MNKEKSMPHHPDPRIQSRLDKTRQYTLAQILEKVIAASDLSWQILQKAASLLQPGISESQAVAMIQRLFEEFQIDRIWHKPYVRFGKHTLLQFHHVATEDLILQEEDIAFIDLGIVKEGIEGDVGMTLTFGQNATYKDLKNATEQIFNEGREYWKQHDPTGVNLYAYISQLTQEMGYSFNLEPAGHLIGAYPHMGWRKGLNTFPEKVSPGHWILEIQIRHPSLPLGGFYESLLI